MASGNDERDQSSLLNLTELIQDEVAKLFASRNRKSARRIFAVDLALIVLSIRTGCLVDTLHAENAVKEFALLLETLRLRQASPLFQGVIHVYHPSLEQSFFVNASLLADKLENHIHDKTVFILLEGNNRTKLLDDVPAGVEKALWKLTSDLANASSSKYSTTVLLDEHLAQDTMVPLAGVLLDYPVAYVPKSADQSNYLSNASLEVYECILASHTTRDEFRHTLLKFSCPSDLTNIHGHLHPSHIISRLEQRFLDKVGTRFEHIGLKIIRCTHTLDRLVL